MKDFTICEDPVGLGKTYIKLKGQQALEIPRLAYECIGEILGDNSALQKANEELAASVERLSNENSLLESNNRGLNACYWNLSDQHASLEAKDAKLCELASQMVKHVECFTFLRGTECARWKECTCDYKECLYAIELRKLGVEVGE